MRVVGSHGAVSSLGPWSHSQETGNSQEWDKHRALCFPPSGPSLSLLKGSSTTWWVKGCLPWDTKEVTLGMASGH